MHDEIQYKSERERERQHLHSASFVGEDSRWPLYPSYTLSLANWHLTSIFLEAHECVKQYPFNHFPLWKTSVLFVVIVSRISIHPASYSTWIMDVVSPSISIIHKLKSFALTKR